jgi:hypothetical protein
MDVSGLDGLNDTPLLAPVLESDNPPLPLGAQREKDCYPKMVTSRGRSYFLFVEKPAHPFVSSMTQLE